MREVSRVPGGGEYLALRVASRRIIRVQTVETVTSDTEVLAVSAACRERMNLARRSSSRRSVFPGPSFRGGRRGSRFPAAQPHGRHGHWG